MGGGDRSCRRGNIGGVDRTGVVAEVEEDGCGGWVGQRECAARETVGNRDGVCERWIDGDGLNEKEIGAGEGAGLCGVRWALQLSDLGEPDERG